MKPYADTNFLIRLLVGFPETKSALQLTRHAFEDGGHAFPIIWLHQVETANALQLLVFQSSRSPSSVRVTPELAASAQAAFDSDLDAGTFMAKASLPVADIERQFRQLCLRHTARHGFRTYDLLHVASSLLLGCDSFWSFDEKACRLAVLEGLKLRPDSR
jgi:predicted nucleic acid-binding protein